ncbi:NAD-dependent epimerase/dehydratase family protein [Pseudomonas graminis]|uniref:NAD-dependent epimerase/dehydratase family protein n=1 Tax=Pseudomonas graminis TaxID=158627 RepID=UPI00234AAD08|nr:NAD-dependent epimerase/dehydratase family protein [Pseudomonas graminis]MDC6380316.1 NAD-dependent epimerase/dehydratase family protein [Pseudomonas graminis]
MIFILGSRGRLGQAIAAQYAPSDVTCVDRSIYEPWSSAGGHAGISEYFAQCLPERSVVYICSGLLDPRLSAEELLAVNYHLPRNVIGSLARSGIRVVTFGTAMEHTLTSNSYVQSKLKLSEYVEDANADGALATHVRIHTLYGGGEPSPFMFIGQILTAIRTESPFAMTLGRQLREYHHVDDDARAAKSLVDAKLIGLVDLAHGNPITLRSLAEAIFGAFGKTHLLQLGALPEPTQDNFDLVFERPQALKDSTFREAIPAVIEYLKSRMNA